MRRWLNVLPHLQRPRVDFSWATLWLGHFLFVCFYNSLPLCQGVSFSFHFYPTTKNGFPLFFFPRDKDLPNTRCLWGRSVVLALGGAGVGMRMETSNVVC